MIQYAEAKDGAMPIPTVDEAGMDKIHFAATQELMKVVGSLSKRADAVEQQVDAVVITVEQQRRQQQQLARDVDALKAGGAATAATPDAPAEPQPARTAQLHRVPPLPGQLCDSAHDAHLVQVLQSLTDGADAAIGITSEMHAIPGSSIPSGGGGGGGDSVAGKHLPVAVRGQGGVGKTVLGIRILNDPAMARHFTGGIYWVDVGQHDVAETKNAVVKELYDMLDSGSTRIDDPKSQLDKIKEVLKEAAAAAGPPRLFYFDDVWKASDVKEVMEVIQAATPGSKMLLTTRDAQVAQRLQAKPHPIDVLPIEAAEAMLKSYAPEEVQSGWSSKDARKVAEKCGRLPVVLAVVGAALSEYSLRELVNKLDQSLADLDSDEYIDVEESLECFGYQHKTIVACFAVGVNALKPGLKERYLKLSAFPEDAVMPFRALQLLWGDVSNPAATRLTVNTLEKKSLLKIGGGG